MSTIIKGGLTAKTTKLLNVGRVWINEEKAGSNRPTYSGQIDRNLGATISLGANDRILFFKNNKREGTRDADFRMAIEVPSEIADEIIASQVRLTVPH